MCITNYDLRLQLCNTNIFVQKPFTTANVSANVLLGIVWKIRNDAIKNDALYWHRAMDCGQVEYDFLKRRNSKP